MTPEAEEPMLLFAEVSVLVDFGAANSSFFAAARRARGRRRPTWRLLLWQWRRRARQQQYDRPVLAWPRRHHEPVISDQEEMELLE